jgi:hypothetical protein
MVLVQNPGRELPLASILFTKVNFKDKKIWLFGIFCACPLNSSLKSCPFNAIRKLPLSERWHIIEGLSEDEVQSLITTHTTCLYVREMKCTKAAHSCKVTSSASLN